MFDTIITDNFIGRGYEQALFREWLAAAEPEAPQILFFHDATNVPEKKGGVGKTWLLNKCATLAKEWKPDMAIVSIDFFNVGDRDGITIAQRVVESLQQVQPSWSPLAALEALAQYRQGLGEHRAMPGLREKVYEGLAEDLHNLEQELLSQKKQLLLFFDTYEMIEENPLIASLSPGCLFPDRYNWQHIGAVIAGRNAPDWNHPNWKGRERDVLCVPVAPFTPQEAIQFINDNSTIITTPELTRTLYTLTEGRPILIGLATDLLNHHFMSAEQFAHVPPESIEHYLVSQINALERPVNWVILFMAHAYHRFNPTLLQWIFDNSLGVQDLVTDIDIHRLSVDLLQLSFVRRAGSGNEFVLHDEMRRLVNTYCWSIQDPAAEYRREISRAVMNYYEHALQHTAHEAQRQAYTVEMLYHTLYVDINAGISLFEQHIARALSVWHTGYARALFQETAQFHQQLTTEQRNLLLLYEAALLRREERYKEALERYSILEQHADQDWLDARRVEMLFEQGECHRCLNNLAQALACFERSLQIAETGSRQVHYADASKTLSYPARIFARLGAIMRHQGRLEEARMYYQRSLDLHRKAQDLSGYAEALTHIGLVYALQGKLEEALLHCKIALRIRQEAFTRGAEKSEIDVGKALEAVGTIYLKRGDLVSAQNSFLEAYDIYVRSHYLSGIAEMVLRFGEIALEKGEFAQALHWFDEAYTTSLEINAAIEVGSLHKRGSTYLRLDRLEEAHHNLQAAVEQARLIHDPHQLVEALITLAQVLERLGASEQVQERLQEAETIAQEHHYTYLLGSIQLVYGEKLHREQQYQQAFHHFGLYCYYMALYNSIEYTKAVHRIVDALVSLPPHELPEIVLALSTFWSSHTEKLDKQAFLLITALDEVRLLFDTEQ